MKYTLGKRLQENIEKQRAYDELTLQEFEKAKLFITKEICHYGNPRPCIHVSKEYLNLYKNGKELLKQWAESQDLYFEIDEFRWSEGARFYFYPIEEKDA